MLSIKAMLSGRNEIPVLIFDEIDMGVSGEIAYKMGSIMHEISKQNQVIAITHLPQVASKGKSHYQVYKEFNQSGTTTKIKLLDNNERIMEIAKMLSGDEITNAAIKNAKELLLA
jgi:DNA repair protein RecN (Recombination protein N)